MLITCWSVKGGVGTTVVACSLALVAARSQPAGALLVDLAGDAALVLGVDDPAAVDASAGLTDWLSSGPAVPPDALGRLELRAGRGLALLPPGRGAAGPDAVERAEALAHELARSERTVVVDGGVLTGAHTPAAVLAALATTSLVVLRNCYLGVRRARERSSSASGVVVLEEPGRAMASTDVAAALGVPLLAKVPYDPVVARVADSGLLSSRLPRSLERAARRVL